MNVFQRIENKIEKEKKDKIEFEKRYWKLSPAERLDYDNQINKINKKVVPFLWFLGTWVKVLLYFTFAVCVIFFFLMPSMIYELGSMLVLFMIKTLWVPYLFEIVNVIIRLLPNEKLKKLNKHYKLK